MAVHLRRSYVIWKVHHASGPCERDSGRGAALPLRLALASCPGPSVGVSPGSSSKGQYTPRSTPPAAYSQRGTVHPCNSAISKEQLYIKEPPGACGGSRARCLTPQAAAAAPPAPYREGGDPAAARGRLFQRSSEQRRSATARL